MSLVSIITPVYNAEKFLAETIESVISQTYENWEMILVNDNSKDASENIIKQYKDKDSRIKYLKNLKNLGPALSRNEAVKVASGQYIAFLDSDDIWLPEKLQKQIDLMVQKNAAISYTLFKRMSGDRQMLGDIVPAPCSLSYEESLKNTAMGTSTVMIDRNLAGSFEVKNVPCDDFFLWSEILGRGFRAWGVMEVLVHYRVLDNSYSRNKIKYALKVWKTYRIMNFSYLKTCWYFMNYAARGLIKYRKF